MGTSILLHTVFRRLRGILSLALIWALVWLPTGVVLGWALGWTGHSLTLRAPMWYLAVWTLLGASSGAIFALLLATLERRRTLDQLSARRLATWGAVAGAALPVVVSLVIVSVVSDLSLASDAPLVFVLMALLSTCAWGTLKIAQRGATVDHLTPPT